MVDSRFYERSPMRRLITLMMVVVVCVGVVVSPRVPSAGAAECKGEISNVQWQNNNHIENGKFVGSYGEGADVQFNWKVDANADEGAEFTLKVPDQLTRLGQGNLTLKSPMGEDVATGTWNESTKTWTFRLTSYAKTHGDISGTAFLLCSGIGQRQRRILIIHYFSQDAVEKERLVERLQKKGSVVLSKQHQRLASMTPKLILHVGTSM